MDAEKPIDLLATTMTTKYRILLVLLALTGALLVWLTTTERGAGLSPDSVRYIGTARNIMEGRGAVSYDDTPLVVQPPLYPLLVAIVGILSGADPLAFAHILNSILFGLAVYLGGKLFFMHLPAFPEYALATTLGIVFSIPLFQTSVMVSSEPLFICFATLSLIFAESYRAKNDNTTAILFSLAIALSSLTRYIGIALAFWGALMVLSFYRDNPRKAVLRLALFLSISSIPLGLWALRNHLVSGTFFGPRASSGYTLLENLSFTFNTLLLWYSPWRLVSFIAIAGAGLLVFLSMWGKGWKQIMDTQQKNAVAISFVFIYIVSLILFSTTTAFDRIGDRLLSPVYIPLTLIVSVTIQKFVSAYVKVESKKVLGVFLLLVAVIWLIYPIKTTITEAIHISRNGTGYDSSVWSESKTIQFLRRDQQLAAECTVYSNAADAIYILTGIPTKSSPLEKFYNSTERIDTIADLKGFWPEETKACLVWLNNVDRTHLFTLEEMQKISRMELIAQFEDGAIYFVTQK